MHFERMARAYDEARPPYPRGIYDTLTEAGVVTAGTRVLEVGAGSGLATRELVARGCVVTALEPGPELARLLAHRSPTVPVVRSSLEDAELPDGAFDVVAAATSLHWVDLNVGLPKLHATLEAGGWLAVWRNRFGDDAVDTPFRRRVQQIVDVRDRRTAGPARSDDRPSVEELSAGGWFDPVRTQHWRWSVDLTTDQVRSLFRTFSDWADAEVDAAARAVDELGGVVTEHYRSVLHLLRRSDVRSS